MNRSGSIGYQQFEGKWGRRAMLATRTLALEDCHQIASSVIHVMDMPFMEQITGHAAGNYKKDPHKVYLAFQELSGACYIAQYIPENPLTMGPRGYESDVVKGATTGAEEVVCDGITIDSPEAVVEHMEKFVFPRLKREIAEFNGDDAFVDKLIASEVAQQARQGLNILKAPYDGGFQCFPYLRYCQYGYVNYFMAYALFPEIMEQDFVLQADLSVLKNAAAARAIIKGGLPRMVLLDHDMADSRGTLVDINSLDQIWFPSFTRSIRPFVDAGIRLTWHCDGNLMDMVPRLLEAGLGGFQGFQYEDGMDYARICKMKDRSGNGLFILGGVSVTTTLPFGKPRDVKDQLKFLVENGPRRGLMLGASSSIAPATPHENISTLIEGFKYYREHGRD